MIPRSKKILLTTAGIAALAVPGVAQARHGADDPVGHVRHSGGDDVRTSSSSTHKARTRTRGTHRRRHGADDGPNRLRHGADDGPNHR
jgi:hypothetical protein